MSRVFTWDEVEGMKIPDCKSFNEIADWIRVDLGNADGAVIGAVLCGSVLNNTHNRHSDIDCFVVYNQQEERAVFSLLGAIHKYADSLYVPIEFIPLSLEISRTRMHHIGPLFASHLRRAAANGGVIKENPLPLLCFDGGVDLTEDLRNYLRNKLRRLEKGLINISEMEEVELCRFLQGALRTPVHIARKMLEWRGVKITDDAKATIVKHYPTIASSQEKSLFSSINSVDIHYTKMLLLQLQNPNKEHYFRTIDFLKETVWEVLEFTRLNAIRFA